MDKLALGRKIREARKARGYSQFSLGGCVGVSPQAVSKWETGVAVPDRTICGKLSALLGFDVGSMIDEELTPDEADALIKKQKNILWKKAKARMRELYGEEPPLQIENHFIIEKNLLYHSKSVIFFDILAKIREAARNKPGRIDIDGSTCFVAWLLGATEINPLAPHLRCPKCRRTEFHPEVRSGWDLKEKACECGGRMIPDGQDLPIEVTVMGSPPLFENFRCFVDTDFMDEAEKIILTYGEQFFMMERYHDDEEDGYMTDPLTGLHACDPETNEEIRIHYLPLSSLIFRPKKKAKARKPEKVSRLTEVTNWGENSGYPTIVLFGGFYQPYYLLKPTPYAKDPAELVQQPVMERALRDYWEKMADIIKQNGNVTFPDLKPYLGKLTFGTFVTLLCSIQNIYMDSVSGPEGLAEKCGMSDLTELPLTMEDLWKLIRRSTSYQEYLSGAALELLRNIRNGKYLVGKYCRGILPKDRKLFRELGLPDWFETYAGNIFCLCFRSLYTDMGMRMLDDARRKIRDGK